MQWHNHSPLTLQIPGPKGSFQFSLPSNWDYRHALPGHVALLKEQPMRLVTQKFEESGDNSAQMPMASQGINGWQSGGQMGRRLELWEYRI